MKTNTNPTHVPPALKNIDVKAVLRKRGVYLEQRLNQELKEAAKPLAQEFLKSKNKVVKAEKLRHAQFTNAQLLTYWEKQIHIVEVVEQHFENKVQQYIHKIVDGFLKYLESEITTKSFKKDFEVKGYFDDNEDDLVTTAQLEFEPLLESVATLAGQEAYKLINSNDVYIAYKYRATIRENVDRFAKSLIDTDKQILSDIISDGVNQGESVAQIRSHITDVFPEYQKTQAQRITRTEVLRASNQAALDAYEQSGVVEGKQWLTAGANDECSQYEGQIVTLSDSFYGSDNEFQDGDPPLHPNCRCVLLPVLANEN